MAQEKPKEEWNMSNQEHAGEDHGHHHDRDHHHHHEHPEHHVTIVVNGREKTWTHETISYEQLVALAGVPLPSGPNPGFTITYHNGPAHHPDATLTEGHSVKVKNDMVFNVTPTNRS